MKAAFSRISIYLGIAVASTLLGITIGAVHAAWFEPTSPPPGGNIDAPLNIGRLSQTKAGGLVLGISGPPGSLVAITGIGIGSGIRATYRNMGPDGCSAASFACGGGLDVVWAGTAQFPSALILGGDSNTPNTRTTGQPKSFWVSMPPYDMSQRLVSAIGGTIFSGVNEIDIGGGNSNLNSANIIRFFTGATQNTPGGTPTVSITSNQLQVDGQVKITGGAPAAGKVLTSDAQGLASWGSAAGVQTAQAFRQKVPSTAVWPIYVVNGPTSAFVALNNVTANQNSKNTSNQLDGIACNVAEGWKLTGCWEIYTPPGGGSQDNDVFPYSNGCLTNDMDVAGSIVELSIACIK